MTPTTALILQVAVFGAVFVAALAAAQSISGMLAVRRRLGQQTTLVQSEQLIRDERVRNPVLAWVGSALLTKDSDRAALRSDLTQAGFEHPAAPTIYVAIRFSLAIALPMLFIVYNALTPTPATGLARVLMPVLLSGAGLFAPRMFINARAKSRREAVEHQFPDALDLMVVCVEAGLGLDAAFVRVGQETRQSHPEISRELGRLSEELAAGRPRAEALRRMADRLNVETIRAFVALLIQTEALGVSAAQSLRTYSVEMRETRFVRAEEKALRIPVLMTIPLVACFMPVVVVALLLPTTIDIIRTLLPAMQGIGR